MGLFGRLRSSSSAQARPTTTEEAPPLPLPPPHTASLYASSSRLSVGVSVKGSHPPESTPTPTPTPTPKSSKPFWKRKAKGPEKDVVGFSYESTSPAGTRPGSFTVDRPPKPREAVGSVLSPTSSRPAPAQSHSQTGYGTGIGYEQDGYGYMRPAIERGQSSQSGQYRGVDRPDTYINTKTNTNTSSPDPRQQYHQQQKPTQYPQQPRPTPKGILKPKAMLGKLDFERDSSTDEDKALGDQQEQQQQHRQQQQQRRSSYTAYNEDRQPATQALGHGQRPQSTMMGMGFANGTSASDTRGREQSVPQPRMSMEEQMEHLVSPEKKQVWTPQSRRMSVSSDIEEPSSPTPRKNGLPPQDLTTPTANANVPAPGMSKAASSDGHTRPQSTRRPSSSRRASFIPLGNPFARSTTRVSSSNDLEGQGGAVDDGSFQLRGFRHVSGASEADFAWIPPTVNPNVDSNDTAAAAPVVTSPTSVHAPIPSRPSSTQPIPSRPVSRATSLQSLDDHIASSAKVSAAAFRKKIRRPSESASTHLDMDDDDDDVPLGMLRPGMRASSALSLSSMKDGARTPGPGSGYAHANATRSAASKSPARAGRAATLSPGLPPTLTKGGVGARTLSPPGTPEVRRPPGPGRSRTTPLISPNEIHPMFPSPAGSPSSSPKLAPVEPVEAKGAVLPEEEVGYFGLMNGTSTSTAKVDSPVAVAVAVPSNSTSTSTVPQTNGGGAVDDSPLFDFKSLDYPIDAFSTSPQAVKTVKLDHGPAVLAPPIAIASSSSPSRGRPETLSISTKTKETASNAHNKLNEASTRQDCLDTDLVIRSMQLYADDNDNDITTDENEPPTPRVALHRQSHSTLFGDASSDNSTIRSPLSERLGNLVGPRPMSSKPSLPKLDTLRLEDGAVNGNGGERVRSPGSDTTISPTVSTIRDHQSVPSSFARIGARGGPNDDSDSESESESEGSVSGSESEDGVVPPKRPDGPPRSSFTNAPRPRVQPPSKPSNPSSNSPARGKPTRGSSASSDGDESSDQDQPLARIKSKASKSKLATSNSTQAQAQAQSTSTRPVSGFDQQNQKQNTYAAIPSAKAATTPLPTTGAPPQFASQVRRASVPAVVSAPMHSGNGNGHGKGPGSPTKPIWSASPASSQSGLTGDSSAVQPVTPSENEMSDTRPFKAPPTGQQQWGESKRASVSWAPEHRTRKSSNYSVATAPPEHGHRSEENAPPVPSLPSGNDPMDPMMRQRMKEVWQAQYMAAASRAFEDEWERQSTASASVAAASIAPQQQYSPYTMPHFPPPQTQPQVQVQVQSPYGMAMPMGYGFPQHQHQHQHQQMPPMPGMPHMGMPHMAQGYYPTWNGMPPPPLPLGYPQQQQAEPSMYAYGAGAQSVYGAEFGPSQAHIGMHHQQHHQHGHQHQHGNSNGQAMSPYARPISMSSQLSYSTNNLHQGTYDNHTQHQHQHQSRPSLPTSKSTSYFSHGQPPQPPPPQGRRRSSRDRDRDSDLDYTPPPTRGSTNSVPSSPRASGANRRSHLGTSVINANDRSSSQSSMMAPPPPTSWRRSSAMPLLAFDEEEATTTATPKKKRASVIVN